MSMPSGPVGPGPVGAAGTVTEPAAIVAAPAGAIRAVLRSWSARIGLVILALFLLVALFGEQLAPYPTTPDAGEVFQPPGGGHLLGTDDAGVDMLSVLLVGARVSLIVGFASALVAMVIGGTIGVLTGYFGGRTDTVLMRIADYFLVIPDVPFMVVMAALFGRSLTNIVLIIALIYWASTARLIRAQTRSVRERAFVRRARALGASDGRILITHVVPQIVPLLLANTVLQVALGIYAETFVTFLGLGDPEAVSWGSILQDAFAASAADQRRLVGDRAARAVRHRRGDRLHPGRAVPGGGAEPAAAGRAPGAPAVPGAPAGPGPLRD